MPPHLPYFYIYVPVCVCVYVCTWGGLCGVSDPLGLELKVAMDRPTEVPGPLQEQQVLLTTGPSSRSPFHALDGGAEQLA